MVVENLPVGFASTHEQRKPGRTQGHGRKPQLEAQQSEVQRPGEDRGRSLHPWGLTGSRYASERGEPTGRSATPSPRTHRPGYHPINDTREASQLSDLPPLCGALQRCSSAGKCDFCLSEWNASPPGNPLPLIKTMNSEDFADSGALICGSVYLLVGSGACYACKRSTRLFAFMALPPFELVGDQDEAMDDEGSLLKEVVDMPASLKSVVAQVTNGKWREDFSRTADQTYWMNHCEWCDAKQGDFFVQGADGPFWPYSEEGLAAIEATKIEGPHTFTAAETTYSGAIGATVWCVRQSSRGAAQSASR